MESRTPWGRWSAPGDRPRCTDPVTSKATRGRVLRRYVLFQLPEVLAGGLVLLLLVRQGFVSSELGLALFGAWLLKEAALFPLLRRAYEPSSPLGGESLIGALGLVSAPPGSASGPAGTSGGGSQAVQLRVRIGPEFWNARLAPGSPDPAPGSQVRVEAVEGLTLIVSAIQSAEPFA